MLILGHLTFGQYSKGQTMPPRIPSVEEMGQMEGQSQGNLSKGIDNCLSPAWSLVQVRKKVLEKNFSNNFSLVQLKSIKEVYKNFLQLQNHIPYSCEF